MNKPMKKRWITALRSGEYRQGKGRLHQENGSMCCLGVLCDIEIDGDWELNAGRYVICGRAGSLPDALKIESGMNLGDQKWLMDLNDPFGKSFDQIADFIEKYL